MAILNYSDLIEDDGAFDKLEREIIDLESFILKEKDKLKGALKVVSPDDSEIVKKYAQAVKDLQIQEAKYLKLKEKALIVSKKDTELKKQEKAQIAKIKEEERKANAELDKSIKLKKAKIATDRQLQKLRQDEIKTGDLIASQTRKAIALKNKENLAERKRLKTIRESNSAYKIQSKELIDLSRRYKDLSIAGRGSGKVARGLLVDIKKLNEGLVKADQATGKFGRNVGNYPKTFGSATASLKSFAGALGVTAGLVGLVNVVKDSIKIFADFEQANANLSAILGKTSDQITKLTDDSKRLGSITKFTASEVAGLQTEFAKLGFDTDEIINATEATLSLASATGTDLAQSAKQVGSAIRAFNLDTTEATRVSDIFALATSKSALDMNFLATAMSIVAPVSKKFGFGVAPTVALLGKLADAGFDASSSATATRNIMLNLADSSSKLAQSLKEPVTDLPSLVKGLNQLKNEGVDLAKALELTDKRSVAAFATFLDGADDIQALSDALDDSGGSAKKMADTQLDTLTGAMTMLRSAWEGVVLSFADGSSTMDGLKKVIKFIAENLKEIIDTVIILTKAFVVYKTATLVATKGLQAYNFIQKLATKGMKSFNKASRNNIIGVIAVALLLAWEAFKKFNSELTTAEKITKNLNDVNAEANKSIVRQQNEIKILTGIVNDENRSLEDKQKAINKLNEISPEYLGNLTLENIATKEGVSALRAYNDQLLETAKTKAILNKIDDLTAQKLDEQNASLDDQVSLWDGIVSTTKGALSGDISVAGQANRLVGVAIENRERDIKSLDEQIEALLAQLNEGSDIGDILGDPTDIEVNATSIKKSINDQFKSELGGLKGIFKEFSEKIIVDIELTSPEQFKEQVDLINGVFGQLEEEYKNDKVKRLEIEQTKLHLLSEANQNYIDELERREQVRIQKIRETAILEVEIQRLKNNTLLIEADNVISESNSLISDLTKQYSEANTKAEKDELKKRIEGEIQFQKDILEAKNEIRKKQIINDAEFRSKKAKEDIKDAELLALELEKIEIKKNNDILKLNTDLNRQIDSLDNKRVSDAVENWKQFTDKLNEVLSLLAEKIEELAQKEVEQTKEKLDEQSDLVDKARDRAEKGLTNNLAFEQKEQAKREKELILAQKRLERIQKAKALYESYSANSSNPNVQNALAKTLRDFAILEAFTKGFKDGGYTGDGGVNDVAGVTHGREFVVDASMTKELGLKGASMTDFKDKFVNGSSWASRRSKESLNLNNLTDQKNRFEKKVAVTKIDTSNLEKEIRELKEWQMNNPTQMVDVRKLTDNILEFVETKKVEGKIDIKRYRVNKKKF